MYNALDREECPIRPQRNSQKKDGKNFAGSWLIERCTNLDVEESRENYP
jgi:hypothetical protein